MPCWRQTPGGRSVARKPTNPWAARGDVRLRLHVGGVVIVVAVALRHVGNLVDDRACPGHQAFGAVIVDAAVAGGRSVEGHLYLAREGGAGRAAVGGGPLITRTRPLGPLPGPGHHTSAVS